jgi:uncharacterized membrane protein
MTEQAPQVVRSYLAQLDAALAGVPADLAGDVRSGIEEELSGLDAATASARIEELGDPVFIAAEVRDSVGPVQAAATIPGQTPLAASRGFAITAALLVAVGGIVVPFVGWVVGIVMVWMSSTWHTWEKWVATLVGPVVIATSILLGFIFGFTGSADSSDAGNPLVPLSPLTSVHSIVLVAPLSAVVVGIWLLWRAKGRTLA